MRKSPKSQSRRAAASKPTRSPKAAEVGTDREPRNARRKRETRERLLDAALRLMAERGMAGVTINEITEAADVGFGSFYNYFESKEAIYDAIINPNASVTMGFETTQLATKDGGIGMGIVRSETEDELVLALPGGVTTSFRKTDIAKRDKLTTSMMPSGLNQALTQDDLVNLVEYLATLKKK